MKRFQWRTLFLFILATCFGLILAGCGGSSGPGSGTGTLELYLMDAPVPGLQEVNVNVLEVKISRVVTGEAESVDESEWITLNTNPLTVNLLDLRFDEALLGTSQLPVGTYKQLRLIIEDNATVVYDDGSGLKTDELVIPSGAQTGLKINLNDLAIAEDARVELVMDVNLGEFIRFVPGLDSHMMEPTAIKVASRVTTGKIQGIVKDGTGADITGTDVLVNALQGGGVVSSTYALTELGPGGEEVGSFSLNLLDPGTYDLEIIAEGFETTTITGIQVQAGAITEVDGDLGTPEIDPILLALTP